METSKVVFLKKFIKFLIFKIMTNFDFLYAVWNTIKN